MKSRIFIEGGGDSKELRIRCREGFRKLLEKLDLQRSMPSLVACGGRNDAFDGFQTAFQYVDDSSFVALLSRYGNSSRRPNGSRRKLAASTRTIDRRTRWIP